MTSYTRIALFICLAVELCASQSTPTASCSTCRTASICNGCTWNADFTTSRNTSWNYGDPAVGTPTAYVYLQLTAYSVISKSAVKGTCVRHTGSPVPLLDPYLELAYKSSSSDFENSFYAEDRTADFSDAWSSANSGLKTQLGYEDCTAASLSSSVVPNWYLPSATASLSATLVKSSVPASHNHTTQIVILSVIVPTVALMIILVGFIAIRRYRKKRSQAVVTSQSTTTTDTQLYVDQKAELEDEERRKHELDGAGISYEMEGEDRIFEMPSGRDAETSVASIRATQELRGLEHSQELDVPGTAV